MKVAVLMGGMSNEREVSLKSGAAVSKALNALGYDVTDIDVDYNLAQQLIEIKPDIAFIALHGAYGEDGTIQGLLEFLKIPYTHSNVGSSAVCMSKEITQKILQESGLPVAKNQFFDDPAEISENVMEFPYVIKPVAEGSSVGVSIIKSAEDFSKATSEWKFGRGMVEEFIPGRELSVPVLENPEATALGAIELNTENDFYDYEAKYTDGVTEHLVPAPLTEEETNKVKELALRTHKTLKCSGISRTDFRFDGENFYILEINTHPGMTELSLVPEIAEFVGIKFNDLIEILVKNARLHNMKS